MRIKKKSSLFVASRIVTILERPEMQSFVQYMVVGGEGVSFWIVQKLHKAKRCFA